MRFVRPTTPHGFLWAFVCLGCIAAGLGQRSSLVAVLTAPSLIALRGRVDLPPALLKWMLRLAQLGALILWAGATILTVFPVAPEVVVHRIATIAAPLLVLIAGVLLLSRASVPRGVLPAVAGAIIAACLDPEARYFRLVLGFAFAAFIGWLATHDDERGTPVSLRPGRIAFFFLTAAAVAIGTVVFLPWAQPQVEGMVLKMVDFDASSGVSTESRLGDVEKLSLSKRIAARLYADRAVNLRVRTFTRFDGRSWRAEFAAQQRLTPIEIPQGRFTLFDETPGEAIGTPGSAVDSRAREARLLVTRPQQGAMPAPAFTSALKVEGVEVDQLPSGVVIPTDTVALYAMVYRDPDTSIPEPEPGPEMLSLPESLDPRIRELAATIAPSSLPPAERAKRIQAFFQSGYRYSLNVGRFSTADPLAEFLFDKRKGYCEYFATASTLLLRLSGVPARYVTGYAVRPFQRASTHYVIRDEDAHAWSEAFLPGRGWVELDATPSADYESAHGNVDTNGFFARLGVLYDEIKARLDQGGVFGLARAAKDWIFDHALALGILLSSFVLFKFRRELAVRRPAAKEVSLGVVEIELTSAARRLLNAIDALCAARGFVRPRSRAPLEHVRDPRVPLAESERATCLRAVFLLYADKYGGRAPVPEEIADLADSIDGMRVRKLAS